MRHLAVALFCLLSLVLPYAIRSAEPTPALAGEAVRINGTGTGLEMMKPLIKAYSESNPGALFEMGKPLGSSGAMKALIAGALDIAVSSKPLKPDEMAKGAKLRIFGKTPLAIVVGNNVPATNISTEELEDIYSGRNRKWSNNENIRVVLRPLEDIDTKILRGLSPGMNAAISRAQSRRGMITAVTDPESNEAVANTIGSIGTSGLTGVLVEKTTLKIISLNGVMPTIASLADGRYPLAKELHFVTMSHMSESAQKFLDFVYSDKGRAIVENVGVLTLAGSQ